jgi:hypothetical protein
MVLLATIEDPRIVRYASYAPNWVSTAGRCSGIVWFRWFLPAEVPATPGATVVSRGTLAHGAA